MKCVLLIVGVFCAVGCSEQVVVGLLDGTDLPILDTESRDTYDNFPGTGTSIDAQSDKESSSDTGLDVDRVCAWAPPHNTNVPMRGVFGFNSQDVWAVGGNDTNGGVLLHFDGQGWSEEIPDQSLIDLKFSANGVWGVEEGGAQEVFIAHDYGVLKATVEDNDIDWTAELDTSRQLPVPLEALFDATWRGIFGNSEREIYAVGGTINVPLAGGTIAHYSGDKWTDMVGGVRVELGINSVQDVRGFGEGTPIFAVTASPMNYGQVIKFTGEGWVVEHSVAPALFLAEWTGLYGLWGRNSDDIFVVGSRLQWGGLVSHGMVLRYTEDDGWNPLDLTEKLDDSELRGVWGESDGARVIVAGRKRNDGLVLTYDGDDWSQMYYGVDNDEPFAFPLNRIWGDDRGNLFIVGDKGIYYCLLSGVS